MNDTSAYKIVVDGDINDYRELTLFIDNPLEQHAKKIQKRAIDILLSVVIILFLLSWLLPILAIIIKLTSKGPIFFVQPRTGYNNNTFNCLKLRSMIKNKEANDIQATENDYRITFAGKFLRKYNLDELPQFINVLMGSMSVIGPRPHMLSHTKIFTKDVIHYNMRHNVKPGITGLAQILGYRGEITDIRQINNRVRLDLFYIKNWSVKLDLYITFKTIRLLLFGDHKAI